MYTHFKTDPNDKDDPRDLLIADGSANANMSMKEMSKYVRPYSISTLETNELLNGYTWREAIIFILWVLQTFVQALPIEI